MDERRNEGMIEDVDGDDDGDDDDDGTDVLARAVSSFLALE